MTSAGSSPAELDKEAVDASATPLYSMAAEISAAIFVGTSSGRSRKTGEELKYAGGKAVEFRLSW